MESSRTKNTKRNVIFSYVYAIVNFLFQFISRTVIVIFLGEKYLGLSSLFGSILTVLNMAELGFSGSIVFNMYKPISEGDTETVCALLAFYKKVYRRIGFIVLISGTVITPFVPKLIKGSWPAEINIYVLYLLYLLNTAISYFLFAYKSSLLNALQRMDITKKVSAIVCIVRYLVQFLALLVFRNYYLFVIVMIAGTALNNIVTAIMAQKKYPEYEPHGEIAPETKEGIMTRVKGLMIGNISSVTYNTFDSIILSVTLGLTSVTIYGNYTFIFSCVSSMIVLIRQAMQASVGNSIVRESKEKNFRDMQLWQFMFSIIAIWCSTCLLCLYQPFMVIWMGPDMLLKNTDVIIFACWFFVGVVPHSYYLYLSGNGMWWEMRWPYIMSAIVNIIMNLVLGKLFGVTGIIFASLFASTVFGFFWVGSIVMKSYFNKKPIAFFGREMLFILAGAATAAITYFICSFIPTGGYTELILRAVVCIVVTPSILLLIFFKTDIFKRALEFAKSVLKQ